LFARTHDEWASAIVRLADDAAMRRAMGEAGFARVREQYSLEAMAPRMVDLFAGLLEASRR
jgi:glycosyltransferase involved in cell wall biosynthesis